MIYAFDKIAGEFDALSHRHLQYFEIRGVYGLLDAECEDAARTVVTHRGGDH